MFIRGDRAFVFLMAESYQGYANRETWALALWLNNDEGLYNRAQEIVADAESEAETDANVTDGTWTPDEAIRYLSADALKEWVEDDLKEMSNEEGGEGLREVFDDVGSLYRIDWAEIAENFMEE